MAWLALDAGNTDWIFRILVFKAIFFTAVVVRLSRLALGMPFSVAWWAYTFPTSALAGALLRYHQAVPGVATGLLAVAALAIATLAFVVVAARSLRALTIGFAPLERTQATS